MGKYMRNTTKYRSANFVNNFTDYSKIFVYLFFTSWYIIFSKAFPLKETADITKGGQYSEEK